MRTRRRRLIERYKDQSESASKEITESEPLEIEEIEPASEIVDDEDSAELPSDETDETQ